MEYIYKYDELTGEYLDKDIARLNPVATKEAGEPVYLVPPFYTIKKPPKTSANNVAIYQNDTWMLKPDYRGCYICDELLNVQVVQEIGEIPDGYILITKAEAEQIANDPLWYVVQDGELVKNPNYEEQKEQQRREYLSMFAITKYDFFKYICEPNEISYQQLLTMVNLNDEIAAAWNLCERVYRGDDTLCTYITQFLPTMTPEVLDEIFESHGKYMGE